MKALKGTDQRCRMNESAFEIPVINRLPKTPVFLNKLGKQVYRTVGQNLLDLGILNEINLMMFTALCREYGIYWEAETRMKSLNDRWESIEDKQGNVKTVPSALHKISKEALNNAKMLAVEFGLTPATIGKISATPTNKKPSIDMLLK